MKINKETFMGFKKDKISPAKILVFGFVVIIFVGALLLNMPIASKNGHSLGFLNSVFTSTSAVCVTGLVVVDTATYWTFFGQTIILILIQIGGLGFMSMTTLFFLLAKKKISIKERLLIQSAYNRNDLSGIIKFIINVLVFTFIIEGIGAVLLSFRFIPEFGLSKGIGMSIFHSISAFCNAGFDLIGKFRSMTPFIDDALVNFTLIILIILGGLGFSVVQDILTHKNLKRISVHSKLVIAISGALVILGIFTLYILEGHNPATLKDMPIKTKLLSVLFHSISPRTAGFNTLDMAQLTNSSKFFTIILMFIGGSPGSTAGGVKTTTIGILIASVFAVLVGKKDTEIFKRTVKLDTIRKALAIIMISLFIIILMTMLLSIFESAEFLEILFEVVSAFATVGLSLGITTELSIIGKIVIIITMFIGRLGPLTIGFAIAKRQAAYHNSHRKYPKTDIMVG